jgi:type III secretion protein R
MGESMKKETKKKFPGRLNNPTTLGFLLVFLGVLGVFFFWGAAPVWAQRADVGGGPISRPLVLLVALAALSMVPFIIVMFTAFVKIVVVLAMIRTALGTQQIPPNQVITGMALILTIYVMMPVGLEIEREVRPVIVSKTGKPLVSNASVDLMVKAVEKGREPLRKFLVRHCHDPERKMFFDMGRKMRIPEDREKLTHEDFSIIIPAFILSELKEAFQIGFMIFLPFLVIDMVVANILLSLGMFQLSPITVSLPFKILLFVLVDGWFVIVRGLMIGYV